MTKKIYDQNRAETLSKAVRLTGGRADAAEILHVSVATISRWTNAHSEIPQAVYLWAVNEIRKAASNLSEV